jgi:hypothetical protein
LPEFANIARIGSLLMKRKSLSIAILLVALLATSDGCYRYQSANCKKRGAAYNAKREKLEHDAHEKLTMGTKKDMVIRFFQENDIPVTFDYGEASGTIYTTGCAPFGCGSDAALLGLRVKVDDAGSVISEPQVGGIYTNCL